MFLRDRALATLAKQLGHPTGLLGRAIGRMLNKNNRTMVTATVAAAAVTPDSAVADVGFGGGVGIELLLQANPGPDPGPGVVHGVEVSTRMIADARARFRSEIAAGRLELHEAPMTALPFPDAALDAVISTNTVYFIDDLAGAFAEVARVLKPGGRFALGIADPDVMARMPFTKHGFRLRPVADLTSALSAAGFGSVEDRRVEGDDRAPHVLVATR